MQRSPDRQEVVLPDDELKQRKPSLDNSKNQNRSKEKKSVISNDFFKPSKLDPNKTGALPTDIIAAAAKAAECMNDSQLRALQQMNEFHGFLPREDLSFLLKKVGDYVLRVSEVEKEGGASGTKWELILSIAVERGKEAVKDETTPEQSATRKVDVKNIIIRNGMGLFYLTAGAAFPTILDLIEHYKNNKGNIARAEFKLKFPIPLEQWEFRRKQISLGKVLGSGAFGEVKLSTLDTGTGKMQVAVKVTKGSGELSKCKIKEMMREARLMRNIKHENIVVTHGVSVEEQPLMIIMELVDGGALDSFLKENVGQVDGDKMGFCLGAARGVAFLHENRIMHRDLAARNCLITKAKVVKISDFGMSKKCKQQYKMKKAGKLPIRWLAPESLKNFVFSYKTDVFSYGVIAYEIFADGKEPWIGKKNPEVKAAILAGICLEIPASTPAAFRDFIYKKIFNSDPEQRADMNEVVTFLESVCEGAPVAAV